MHEISIVRTIVSTLKEKYEGDFEKITKVEIEAGLLSNIQPVLIQNAFEALRLELPELMELELEVKVLSIIARCSKCNENFEVKYHRFICPCGEPSKEIIQGDELQISKVELINI